MNEGNIKLRTKKKQGRTNKITQKNEKKTVYFLYKNRNPKSNRMTITSNRCRELMVI